MPAPSDSPEFATSANFTVDGDAWGGDPTKADPGAPRKAEGFEPSTLPAEWLNWVLNNHGAWLVSRLSGTRRIPLNGAPVGFPGATAWARNGIDGWGLDSTTGTPNALWRVDFTLPPGCVLSSVVVRVQPGDAYAAAGDRMAATLRKLPDGSNTWADAVALVTDSGAAGAQNITLTPGAPITVLDGDLFSIEVRGGALTDLSDGILSASAVIDGP